MTLWKTRSRRVPVAIVTMPPGRAARGETYRPAKSLEVAVQHLELAPVFVGLLLGLAQSLGVPTGRIRQVRKLAENKA